LFYDLLWQVTQDVAKLHGMRTLPPDFSEETRAPLFPPQVAEMLMRRGKQLVGCGLIAFSFVSLICMSSYSAADISFNTATGSGYVANLLGSTGAYIADLLVQGLGVASFALLALPAGWGARLLVNLPLSRMGWRIAAAIPALALAAGAAASVQTTWPWPFGQQPGGIVGTLSLHWMTSLLPGAWDGFSSLWPALFSGGIAAVLLFWALGFSYSQWIYGLRQSSAFTLGLIAYATIMARRGIARLRGQELPELPQHQTAAENDEYEYEEEEYEEELDDSSDEIDTDGEEEEEQAPPPRKLAKGKRKRILTASGDRYEFPHLDILSPPKHSDSRLSQAELQENAEILLGVLGDFGVQGEIIDVSPGPVVTLYELEPAPGTKSARVIGLSDDIARQMSALSVRVATVPGRNVLGIELSNSKRETVYLRELIAHASFTKTQAKLPLALGKDISGAPVVVDMARMPHLLVAGTTGSGKSVSVNTMILSLLYCLTPDQVRLIMIDPKMLELSIYEGIPHLLTPVVTEPKKAVVALKWTVREMEDRYRAMARVGVRNIDGYNERVRKAREDGETLTRRVQTGFDADTGKPVYEEQPIDLIDLPYIVVVVDEMADLMLVAGKDIEAAVQRIAQMARAAGIHLIMATQRPSVDVITGTIKANFPSRISFQVTSKIDSRTILGEQGAEQLLGQGDMLYMASGGRITRVHGPFVSDAEVLAVVEHLKTQGEPNYIEDVTTMPVDEEGSGSGFGGDGEEGSGDDLYDRAVQIVLRERKASTSYIQRCLQIGYNRAARLVDRMEAEGLVGPANHVGKREILVPGESAR
jgi:S-DNA-T family DNA segregation ATPase FtsK/SpoIIIE